MAVLAGLTLIFGVYPDPILNPLTGYVESIFPQTPVFQLPTHTKDLQGEQQEKLGLEQSNLVANHAGFSMQTPNLTPPSHCQKGKINGESD